MDKTNPESPTVKSQKQLPKSASTVSKGYKQTTQKKGTVEEKKGPVELKKCPEEEKKDPDEPEDDEDLTTRRGNWVGKLDFFFSLLGYCIGLGNIWRFPFLCYQNGGGAFLVPYSIFLFLCGMPLFMLEANLGQFSCLGSLTVWRISPLFKGIGYATLLMGTMCCIYYNVIVAWALHYLYYSFRQPLPWTTCDNSWNTKYCLEPDQLRGHGENETYHTSSQEYWNLRVLKISSGIDHLGEIRPGLLTSLAVVWLMTYLILFKGVKSSGKIAYFTAIYPYVMMFILVVRTVSLKGAKDGIHYYLTPQWEKLLSVRVWGQAATQIFYSTGTGWGAILTMSSYNQFHDNCYRDSILVPILNGATSLFAGFAVFSVIGFMADHIGEPVDEVVTAGPGLVFVVYPLAVAVLPYPCIWAVLFFTMVIIVGIDSQFALFDAIISCITDEVRILLPYKSFVTFLGCLLLFILGIPCVMQGGAYVLNFLDWYTASFPVVLLSLFRVFVIARVYGVNRFMADMEMMHRRTISRWWKWCWSYITPILILFILAFFLASYTTITYNKIEYPMWAAHLGWCLVAFILLPVPVVAVRVYCLSKGTFKQRIISSIRPTPEWGPALPKHRTEYMKNLEGVKPMFVQEQVAVFDPEDVFKREGETASIITAFESLITLISFRSGVRSQDNALPTPDDNNPTTPDNNNPTTPEEH